MFCCRFGLIGSTAFQSSWSQWTLTLHHLCARLLPLACSMAVTGPLVYVCRPMSVDVRALRPQREKLRCNIDGEVRCRIPPHEWYCPVFRMVGEDPAEVQMHADPEWQPPIIHGMDKDLQEEDAAFNEVCGMN